MNKSKKRKTILLANDAPWVPGDVFEYVYGEQRIDAIRQISDLYPERITTANSGSHQAALREAEAIFSCWGMPPLTPAQLDEMPNLQAVFYASGSVKGFAGPFLDRGIVVCSAVEANAIPVAEFCLAQILLSCKAAFRNSRQCRQGPWVETAMPSGTGAYGETIAILGLGAISRYLLQLLRHFQLRVVLVSGHASPKVMDELGIAAVVDLEQAFREAFVVCNLMADRADNKKVLGHGLLGSMREGATFINTGRGAQVDEEALIEVFRRREDLTALLDVQDPEPPVAGSALYTLPNVHLTSHIAGSKHNEVRRMADMMIEDFKAWDSGLPTRHRVKPEEFKGRA